MIPNYDYGLVTKQRWLWPIIDIAFTILWTICRTAQTRAAIAANRCHASHCKHHDWS